MPKLTAVPSLKSSAKSLKLKQRVLFGLIAAGFLCGPLGLLISANKDYVVPPLQRSLIDRFPDVVPFARLVAEDYLSGRATVLPTAKDVPQDFGRSGAVPALPHGDLELAGVIATPDRTAEVGQSFLVTFQFRADSGVLYQVRLIVHPVPANGVTRYVLGAVPTLTPFPAVAGSDALAQMGLAGEVAETVPGLVDEAITRWGRAYTSGDPKALKDEVNVGAGVSPQNEYLPLVGFALENTPQRLAATRATWIQGEFYLARVRLMLQKDGFRTSTDYDVLVQNDGTGHVVAWGAPGTGSALRPQANRIG